MRKSAFSCENTSFRALETTCHPHTVHKPATIPYRWLFSQEAFSPTLNINKRLVMSASSPKVSSTDGYTVLVSCRHTCLKPVARYLPVSLSSMNKQTAADGTTVLVSLCKACHFACVLNLWPRVWVWDPLECGPLPGTETRWGDALEVSRPLEFWCIDAWQCAFDSYMAV